MISRDIHRTFPEHPQFGFQQGQQALFRVLKAYSLHDLEVRQHLPCRVFRVRVRDPRDAALQITAAALKEAALTCAAALGLHVRL